MKVAQYYWPGLVEEVTMYRTEKYCANLVAPLLELAWLNPARPQLPTACRELSFPLSVFLFLYATFQCSNTSWRERKGGGREVKPIKMTTKKSAPLIENSLCALSEWICLIREYWMIYWGPSCLAVEWFGSFPTSLARLLSVSSTGDTQETKKEGILADGSDGVGVRRTSQIIRPREGLVLYKSYNTLCS